MPRLPTDLYEWRSTLEDFARRGYLEPSDLASAATRVMGEDRGTALRLLRVGQAQADREAADKALEADVARYGTSRPSEIEQMLAEGGVYSDARRIQTMLTNAPDAFAAELRANARRFGRAPSEAPPDELGGGPPDILAMLEREATAQSVPPDLVRRVAKAESGFRTNAVSPKGARGVMQLMPGTAAELGVDPNDPAQNIKGGVAYLKKMLDRYHGDTTLARAAYNAGPGAVDRYGGVPPYAETQDYIRKTGGPEPSMSAQGSVGRIEAGPIPATAMERQRAQRLRDLDTLLARTEGAIEKKRIKDLGRAATEARLRGEPTPADIREGQRIQGRMRLQEDLIPRAEQLFAEARPGTPALNILEPLAQELRTQAMEGPPDKAREADMALRWLQSKAAVDVFKERGRKRRQRMAEEAMAGPPPPSTLDTLARWWDEHNPAKPTAPPSTTYRSGVTGPYGRQSPLLDWLGGR